MSKLTVLILATADFDAPIWTNKQHIASRLSSKYNIIYVNSIGLRRLTLSLSDLRRVLRRLISIVRRPSHSDNLSNLVSINPYVLPFHANKVIGRINGFLLRKQVTKISTKLFSRNGVDVLWTFSPITFGLEALANKTYYHLVDLLHTVPGVSSSLILESEERLALVAEKSIGSSTGVVEHLKEIGFESPLLWENVADIELFQRYSMNARKDRVVYFGNLTAIKIDFNLLLEVAHTGLEVYIAGPTRIDGTDSPELADLFRHTNVKYLGVLDQPSMARICGESKVGLIPYKLNEHTAGIFPMKVFEYLAAGLIVVSTELTSLKNIDLTRIVRVPGSRFQGQVLQSLSSYSPPPANFHDLMVSNSWESRVEQIVNLINQNVR